jgi:hypothetical protein
MKRRIMMMDQRQERKEMVAKELISIRTVIITSLQCLKERDTRI